MGSLLSSLMLLGDVIVQSTQISVAVACGMVQQICSQGFQVPAPFLPSMLDRHRSVSESEVFIVLLRERGALVVTFNAIADVQHDGFQSSNNSCGTGVESLFCS